MKRLSVLGITATLAAVASTGCLVQITEVRDPEPLFRQARADAQRFAGRPGPAHELNVLVYDPSDRQLVRVSLPMWLVRKVDGKVNWDGERGGDRDRIEKTVRRHVRLKDIEKAGLGILAEVEDDDGEQVLVWLR